MNSDGRMRAAQIIVGVWFCALVSGGGAALSATEAVKGAAELVIPGGKGGDVAFPHRRHQENLGTCAVCHSVFPQQAGAIDALKAQGKLKPKQVMNKQCTGCHREKKRAGEKAGPTTCTGCHRKE